MVVDGPARAATQKIAAIVTKHGKEIEALNRAVKLLQEENTRHRRDLEKVKNDVKYCVAGTVRIKG